MKRWLWLLPLLCFLGGCGVLAGNAPHTEPAQPAVLEMSPPVLTGSPGAEETAPDPVTEDRAEDRPEDAAEDRSAGTGEPTEPDPEPEDREAPTPEIPYQSGDTTPGWRPELAENYPPDSACDAAALLEKWMAVEGLTMRDLDARDCRQLILVSAQPADGVTTRTACYERAWDGSLQPVTGLDRLQGFVGKNGIMHDRRRNTNTSPAGLWAIGMAFGNEKPPEELKLPWRQVTPESDWVCDEGSHYFNTWQERDDPGLIPWSDDVEHLADYPTQYAWACVIEFNRPPDVVPARGCAIFLHCARTGTGGCVGLRRADMLAVLSWLDAEKKPHILITGAGN